MPQEIIRLVETTEKLFEDYYAIRCDETDVYWNGYTSQPNHDNFRALYLQRLSSAPFEEPESRRLYLIEKWVSNFGQQFIGFVQLIKREDAVEIGYSILKSQQQHGYGTQALALGIKLALAYGENIIVRIRDDNIASQKVALKNGFIRTELYEEHDYPQAGTVKLRTYRLPE